MGKDFSPMCDDFKPLPSLFLGVIKMWFHFSSKIPSSSGGGWWICVTSFAQSLKQEECEEGKQILDH